MKGSDGLDFQEMLSKVAGEGVDIGEPKTTPPPKEETGGKGSANLEQIGRNGDKKTVEVKDGGRKKRKRKTPKVERTFNIKNYSRVLVQKNLLNFLGVIHPDLNSRDIVNAVLYDYVTKNQDKIQKSMDSGVKKIH